MKEHDENEEQKGLSMLEMIQQNDYEIPEPDSLPDDEIPEAEGPPSGGVGEGIFGPPAAKPPSEKSQKARAKMAVVSIDMFLAKTSAAISGGHSADYKMEEDEKKDYTQLTQDFFDTFDGDINPRLIWWATTGTLILATLYRASEDKKAKTQAEEYKKAKERYQQAMASRAAYDPGQAAEAYQAMKESKPKGPQRGRFEIDADGLYEYAASGSYLKKADRKEFPPPDVKKLIDEGKELNQSAGEINRQIREYLYGETS